MEELNPKTMNKIRDMIKESPQVERDFKNLSLDEIADILMVEIATPWAKWAEKLAEKLYVNCWCGSREPGWVCEGCQVLEEYNEWLVNEEIPL